MEKKQVVILGIIISVIVVVLVAGLLISNVFKGKEKNLSEENKNVVEDNIEDEDSPNDTPVDGLIGETLDYYWNIDTQSFDKSKFNGEISFYGNIINGKITTDKLLEVGIEIKRYKNSQIENETLNYNNESDFWYLESPYISKNGEALQSSTSGSVTFTSTIPYIINYTNNEIYSEHSYVMLSKSFGWNLTKYDIYPNILDIESAKDINIDLVLDKLGNPTYVSGRTDKTLKSIYGYTTYVYVYDEVVFLFAFYNSSDLSLAASYYYPIETLQQKDSDGKTTLDELEEGYQTYLLSK